MEVDMSLQSLYDEHGTLVFGHRGAAAYAPENTIAAFMLAIEQGAHGVEFDVHLTRDGVPVVIHDFDLDKTTTGHGSVVEHEYEDLEALDAGSHKGEEFAGEPIPTLEEVFRLLAGRLAMNIEVKADTEGIEDAVAALIDQYGVADWVIVSSFNPLVLQRLAARYPHIPLGFLYDESMPYEEMLQLLSNITLTARHPHHSMIDAPYVRVAKQFGYRVNTWTVNDPARAIELQRLGVDVVITDTPDLILKALGYA
jgi:glycerophosphoryl diester phosphodiesterase